MVKSLNECRDACFQRLWQHYTTMVPEAGKVEDLLRSHGQTWNEDHVAFRSLPGPHTGAHILQAVFETLDYERRDDFYFEGKQLNAFWMAPKNPETLGNLVPPKVFISELIPDRFSPEFQQIITKASASVTTSPLARLESLISEKKYEDFVDCLTRFLTEGPAWQRPTYAEFCQLRSESEYAAWTYVYGSVVNHFTVAVHLMDQFASLDQFNQFLVKNLSLQLNESGGQAIKGSPDIRLEQSATIAHDWPALFQEGPHRIPYAFVEFAFRFPLPDKQPDKQWSSYFQGFVEGNADKIFDSTNIR